MSIAKDDFAKSLARLEGLAKSQLFHTPSDSNPGDWAGSAPTDEDSMDDGIQENGTDYDGVKKALGAKVQKSKALTQAEVAIVKGANPYGHIKQKIAKGEGLTGAERWVLKGLGRKVFANFAKAEGMANTPTKDGAAEENKTARNVPGGTVANKEDGKEDPEADPGSTTKGMHGGDCKCGKCMGKSLMGAASQQPDLAKGIEMSPVLHQFAVAMGQALEGAVERINTNIAKALAPIVGDNAMIKKALAEKINVDGEFQKGLAEAVVGIGQQLAGQSEVAAQGQHLPAGGPRSQLRALPGGAAPQGQPQVFQKSFNGPGGLDVGEGAMAKSQIVNVMTDMVKSGKLNATEVIKFESTNELNPQVQQAVLSWAQGNRG